MRYKSSTSDSRDDFLCMIFGSEITLLQDSNNQESRDNNVCVDVIIIENNDERMVNRILR